MHLNLCVDKYKTISGMALYDEDDENEIAVSPSKNTNLWALNNVNNLM